MNDAIISFKCPQCGAIIETTNDTLTARCRYCKHEILTSDIAKHTKISNEDRLATYSQMAENAFNNNDYNNAEIYCRLICELNLTASNIAKYNCVSYLNSKIDFSQKLIDDTYNINTDLRLSYLTAMHNHTLNIINNEIAAATEYCITSDSRKHKSQEIYKKHNYAMTSLIKEIKAINPNFVSEYIYTPDISNNKKGVNNDFILSIAAIGFFIIVIAVILFLILK